MPYENINIQLSIVDEADIKANIEILFSLLPFLINLSKKERQYKGGAITKKPIFIKTAFEIATNNPTLVPQKLSMPEWENDMVLHQQLTLIHQRIKQLEESLNDTLLALKAEKSKSASLFYNTLKILQKTHLVEGIDAMVKALKEKL